MHECNDKCTRMRLSNPVLILRKLRSEHYEAGWRWCNVCELGFLFYQQRLRCDCCGAKFRVSTHARRVNYIRLHPTKRLSYFISLRKCNICNLSDTYTHKRGYKYWYRDKDGHMCSFCYNDIKNAKLREYNSLKRKQEQKICQ